MPVLVIALLGGFTVNFLWCLFLNAKNKTFGDNTKKDAPIVPNVIFGAIAGAIWVCQFVAFKTGEPQMGSQSYVGWAVLMASSIMFSGALGLILGEWKGTSSRTRGLLGFGLAVLLGGRPLRLQRQARPGHRQTDGSGPGSKRDAARNSITLSGSNEFGRPHRRRPC